MNNNKAVIINVSFFLAAVLLLIVLTFYNSFYRLVTLQQEYSAWVSIHAVSLAVWVLLLLIQPLLIFYGKNKWHRQLGFLSIGIVAVIIITTVFVSVDLSGTISNAMPTGKKNSILFSQLYGMALFAVLYTMALINARQFVAHIQYIMASTIVILGPVIFRATNNFQLSFFGTAAFTANILTYLFLNLFLISLCVVNARKAQTFLPYLLTIAALVPIEAGQIWFARPGF